jgi:hypothetical protein
MKAPKKVAEFQGFRVSRRERTPDRMNFAVFALETLQL